MNYSFFLLGLPIILLNIPTELIISLSFLMFSSFLYHNNEEQDTSLSYFILVFDQLNIINTSCMISFYSFKNSFQYMSLYLLEKYIFDGSLTAQFVYFIAFINLLDLRTLLFFILNTLIYIYVQNREFSTIERYVWHLSQSIYIIFGLIQKYPFRKFLH